MKQIITLSRIFFAVFCLLSCSSSIKENEYYEVTSICNANRPDGSNLMIGPGDVLQCNGNADGGYEFTVVYSAFQFSNYISDLKQQQNSVLPGAGIIDFNKTVSNTGDAVILSKEQAEGNITITYYYPLSKAIYNEDIELVKELIKKGADVNEQSYSVEEISVVYTKQPLITVAASTGNNEIIQILIDNGANLFSNNIDGFYQPLWGAAAKGHLETVKLLVENGADINAKDKDGGTALYIAYHQGNKSIADYLIQKGAELDITSPGCINAFIFVVDKENANEIISYLIDQGIDVNAKSTLIDNQYALTYAASIKKSEIVKLLVEKGADVNVKDYNGNTALYYAAKSENIELVKFLLDNGADPSVAPWGLAAVQRDTKNEELKKILDKILK